MQTAYIQSVGGASGDMLLGALLDAGLPIDAITDAVDALQIPNVQIAVAAETRCDVRGSRALVDTANAPRYSPRQMLDAIANAVVLSNPTRTKATAVLEALFAAEARVHGSNPADIHLHELADADTLVDVVGVIHGLEQLGVERICASPLVLGEATGPRRPNGYSNPAPATLEIIANANAPVAPQRPFHANVGELTTPTGAALITTLANEYRQPAMTLNRIGVGIGRKNPPAFPNVIRLWLGQITPSRHSSLAPNQSSASSRHSGFRRNPQPDAHPITAQSPHPITVQSPHPEPVAGQPFAHWQDNIILLETNLDNATGEQLGYAMAQLFDAGALDVWHTPIQMKKNRPAILLSALAPAELETRLAEAILRHTPTLGVRVRPITRYVAHRDIITVQTEYGPIRLKRKWLSGQIVSQAPEHDDIANAAQTHNLPWQTIAAVIPETPPTEETDPSHRPG